jgi:6-phosphogluconolactonase (cycloisomerase 2 family)
MRGGKATPGAWVATVLAAAGLSLVIAAMALAATGALTPQGCIDDNDTLSDPAQGPDNCAQSTNGLAGAKGIALSSNGKSLYATSGEDDAIVSFKRNKSSGKLKPQGCIDDNDTGTDPTQGEDNCSQKTNGLQNAEAVVVSRDGTSAYAISSDDAVVSFKRNKRTGKLKPKGCIDDNDTGADNCSQSTNGLADPQALVLSGDGKSLYVASGVDNAVVRFVRNTKTGKLKPRGCVDDNDTGPENCSKSTNGLAGAGALALTQNGKSLYVVGEDDDAVVRFKRNTKTGTLKPQGCVDDNDFGTDPLQGEDNCDQSTNGLGETTSVALSRDGKSLYAGSEQDSALVRFGRSNSGALTPQGCIEDNDTGPDDCAEGTNGLETGQALALSPDDRWLYGSSEADDAIVRFKRALN